MGRLILTAAGVWVLFLILAILNAVFRDKVLGPVAGDAAALPLSGVLLSLILFLVTLAVIPRLRGGSALHDWAIGGAWVLLTLAFEFFFGHFVMGKPWKEILGIFDVAGGNLMPLVLAVILISPYLARRLRG
jgi:hypothetical protein